MRLGNRAREACATAGGGPPPTGCRELRQASKALISNRVGQHLDLDFLAFKTRRNKSLLFKPPSLWTFVTSSLSGQRLKYLLQHHTLDGSPILDASSGQRLTPLSPQEAHSQTDGPGCCVHRSHTAHAPPSLMDPSTHQGVHCTTKNQGSALLS